MEKDTLLTVGMSLDTKTELKAVSVALDMSGMGAVVRAVLEGRLPPLPEVPKRFTPAQYDRYRRFKEYQDG